MRRPRPGERAVRKVPDVVPDPRAAELAVLLDGVPRTMSRVRMESSATPAPT